jgi:uncharacterized protein (DUF983 family)
MAQMQLQLALIPHQVENTVIHQRALDGYVNATAMCEACGKKLNHYLSNKTAQEFLTELSSVTGIPVTGLVVIKQGGIPAEQGTWVHPDVAINLGQWCSPKSAVAVSKWVREWMSGKFAQTLPCHLTRYLANMSEVPHTHFSMLNELTLNLIAPLEINGYTLPENLVPDISEGRMFSQWLRTARGIDPSTFPSYPHRYTDGRVVMARLYPMSVLEDFRRHFHEVWVPTKMIPYFKTRDPKALEFFPRAFPLLYGAQVG